MNITETDRATVRRVIRRHMGAPRHAAIKLRGLGPMCAYIGLHRNAMVTIYTVDFDAACEAAALGRAYATALRRAR